MKKSIILLLLFTSISIQIIQAQPTDYILYYPFNGNANDASINQFNGTVSNASLTFDINNAANSAYFFNGASSYIKMPDMVLPNANEFSISLWFKPIGTNSSFDVNNIQSILDLRRQYQIYVYYTESSNSSKPNCVFYETHSSAGGSKRIYSADNSVSINAWNHLVATFGNNIMNLYLNNILVGSIPNVHIPDPIAANSNYLSAIGKEYSISSNLYCFNGDIDEVKIFNRSLTLNEVQTLFNTYENNNEPNASWQIQDNNVYFSQGNVLIGKLSQSNSTYRLDVEGKIRANEIVINTSGADFVFAPTYKLRTLSELEQFVKTNNHLPEIPSATEMQQQGVSVSDMQTKLLQKMEELTLYVIEQEKKIEQLNKENQEIKNLLK